MKAREWCELKEPTCFESGAHTWTPCFQKAWSRSSTIAREEAVACDPEVTELLPFTLGPPIQHIPTASTASVMGISGVRSPGAGAPSGVTSFREPGREWKGGFEHKS